MSDTNAAAGYLTAALEEGEETFLLPVIAQADMTNGSTEAAAEAAGAIAIVTRDVVIDNTSGMREVISHLVKVHGCRRLAFIRDVEYKPYTQLGIVRSRLATHAVCRLGSIA